MTKLALVKKDFHSSGGLEKVTGRILSALLKKGVDVSLFTSSTTPLPCPTQTYVPQGFLKVQKLKDFDRWLKKQTSSNYDVIFSMDRCSYQTHHRAGNGVHAAYLDLRAKAEGRLKKWSFSLNPLHQFHLELEKTTFESPHTRALIVNSEMVRDQVLHYYNVDPSKIHVIHNGVEWAQLDTDFHDSLNHHKEHAVNLGLDPSVYQFLFVGHNFERKGLKNLLKALSHLSNKNFHLSIVGSDKNQISYELLASELGLETQVTFFGPQTSTKPFYLASDALVIPSLYDPFANVTVEALALGLFVVSSKMNGGSEILQPNSGVVVSDSSSIEELTAALEIALKKPKESASASLIRSTVAHLDYPIQLEKICQLCTS